jgi:hypothetical protein
MVDRSRPASRATLGGVLLVIFALCALVSGAAGAQVGKCRTPPCGNVPCNEEAWKEYKKHLAIAVGQYDEGFADSDSALAEFREKMKEIQRETAAGLIIRGRMSVFEIELLDDEIRELQAVMDATVVTMGRTALKKGVGAGAKYTVGAEIVSAILEALLLSIDVDQAVRKLNAASLSEKHMFDRGNAAFEKSLADLKSALDIKSCDRDRSRLKSEQSLDDQAKSYLDALPLNGNGTYHLGDENYSPAAALKKAKQIITSGSQSGAAAHPPLYFASAPDTRTLAVTDYVLTAAQFDSARAELRTAISRMEQERSVAKARLAKYHRAIAQFRVLRARLAQ